MTVVWWQLGLGFHLRGEIRSGAQRNGLSFDSDSEILGEGVVC